MSLAAGTTSPLAPDEAVLERDRTSYTGLTEDIVAPVLRGGGRTWWLLFTLALGLVSLFVASVAWLFWRGVGVWGINSEVVWGFAIANYVWWIGIGNAGTLISAMLLLTRQQWRASISRFAEAMTLFAAAIAGLFPILHLGRPWLFYWLVPYPNTMALWPQWRSPLVWDFFAIASYLLFSSLFWYTGAIPDFATMRDRARSLAARRIYGAFALGWRGSARHWRAYRSFYTAMAALGVPLVVSVHSVVGMDFAASLMPGWRETIFPPYFVVGAMFSGFAMVVLIALALRRGLGLSGIITARHLDAMGKIIVFAAIVMAISYATEWFAAWASGDALEHRLLAFEFTGPYAGLYYLMIACNCLVPQLLWSPRARRSVPAVIAVCLLVLAGMWLERILIIAVTLSAGALPSVTALYLPSVWDWTLFAGTLGLFLLGFLVLVRVVPAASIHEIKEMALGRGDLQ